MPFKGDVEFRSLGPDEPSYKGEVSSGIDVEHSLPTPMLFPRAQALISRHGAKLRKPTRSLKFLRQKEQRRGQPGTMEKYRTLRKDLGTSKKGLEKKAFHLRMFEHIRFHLVLGKIAKQVDVRFLC